MESYNTLIKPKKNVELIFISCDRSEDAALKWAIKENFPWPTVLPDKLRRSGLEKYAQRGIPSYTLIDKEGKILAQGKYACFEKIKEL